MTLTEGILRYSRDLAFGAASAYAEAAETRGAWDSRLEATVVDAVVRGDTGPDMLSRAAALNWDTNAPATVIVGTPARKSSPPRPHWYTRWRSATDAERWPSSRAPDC